MAFPTKQTIDLQVITDRVAIGARRMETDQYEVQISDRDSILVIRMTREQATRLLGSLNWLHLEGAGQ